MADFKHYLMEKFIEWEKEQPRRQTYTAFAHYLGVSQSSLTQWMAGSYLPSPYNIDRLASILGVEIYDVLRMDRPPVKHIGELQEFYDAMPPDQQARALQIIEETLYEFGYQPHNKRTEKYNA